MSAGMYCDRSSTIIGAGLSGLVAGCELSNRGVDVAMFEGKSVGELASSYYSNNYHIQKRCVEEILSDN